MQWIALLHLRLHMYSAFPSQEALSAISYHYRLNAWKDFKSHEAMSNMLQVVVASCRDITFYYSIIEMYLEASIYDQ